jgi:thiol:disulfide interchange protein DsbD
MGSGNILQHGWLWAFASVFVGGFLTSLTPCVYPLIPITVSLFGARGEGVTRGRAMTLAGLYVGGIGVMYASLGVSCALAGRAFGTFMANPLVMVPIALLFVVMAASMFGAFELQLPPELQQRLSRVGGKGFAGAFLMGMVSGVIAAPCTGPVLASILAFVATTRSAFLGAGLLMTYALGMGVLFFAIAAFAIALPKSGAWMDGVKSVFGVVMLVAALYFLRNVSAPLRGWGSATTTWFAVNAGVLLLGVLVGGIHLSFKYSPALEKVRKAAGTAAIVAGAFGLIAGVLAPRADAAAVPLEWVHGEREGVRAAQAEHRPALVDFYADWCLPCKELELKTFSRADVSQALQRFKLVKVNCTSDEDPAVEEAKKRWNAATLPTVLLLDSSGKVMHKIDHFVSGEELLDMLRDAS